MRTFDRWLLAFLTLAALQRFWLEGREHLRARRGAVTAPWTGYLMVACHLLTYGGTVIEVLQRQPGLPLRPAMSGVGLAMFLGGFLMRRWAIRTLGHHWSLHIELRPGQPLIREGPYRFIRHPNYLGLLLEVLALPLIGHAYRTLLFVLLCYCPLIVIRLRAEDRALLTAFPQAYREYQRRCGALLPAVRWNKTRRA